MNQTGAYRRIAGRERAVSAGIEELAKTSESSYNLLLVSKGLKVK
jgi:hypothetical protein